MTKKKKIIVALCAAAVLIVGALGFLYVFVYDGFNIVGRLVGWRADLPEDMVLDRSLGQLYTTGENDYMYFRVSRERSPYVDVQGYIDYYFDRFYMSPDWRAANDAELLRDDRDGGRHIITLRLNSMPEGLDDTYTYVTVLTPTRYFLRAIIKYDSRYRGDEAAAAADRAAESLKLALSTGGLKRETDFRLELPESWSQETREAFQRLTSAQTPYFGVFTKDLAGLEEKIGHQFPVILTYFQLNEPMPRAQLEEWYSQGRITELTLQLTVTNNMDLYTAQSPVLAVLSGQYDDTLNAIADEFIAFGHPVLFRLNNEMNSDWTSYAGVVNLADPDLYTAAWRYIYDLFQRRGVDNAIWVWNPNDQNFPPCNWNSYLSYWPGNGYAQVIGLTGYNTGTYYHEVTAESWRDFTGIYDTLQAEYGAHFGEFPWMITEFASSSIGGDKPGWINDMFTNIGKYGNIKAAVWFDFADYDYSKPEAPVSRPYWIAETEETAAAFAKGVSGTPERFFE